MGYFTDAYSTLIKDFDKAFGKQREVIEGSTDAANREADANAAIAASRGGYSGSGLESTLFSRNKALFTQQKNKALTELAANQEGQRLQLKQNAMNAGLQDKVADQDFWGNLLQGGGAVLGTALKIFGGPGGMAAGTAIDAATGMTKGLSYGGSGGGTATSNYKIGG
jgi:hypothetical protein